MKYFAIISLTIFFTIQIALADWRYNTRINHWNQIEFIVTNLIKDIELEAEEKGTAYARQCGEVAKLQLSNAKAAGRDEVDGCCRVANEERYGEECCERTDRQVFKVSLIFYKAALMCINSA